MYGGSAEGRFFQILAEFGETVDPRLALEDYDKGLVPKEVSDAMIRRRTLDGLLQLRFLDEQLKEFRAGGCNETLICNRGFFEKVGDWIYAVFVEEFYDEIGYAPAYLVKKSYADGYLGLSVTNYLALTYSSITVPTPATMSFAFHILPQVHYPWTGSIAGATCIFLGKDGSVSHFGEGESTFRKHFSFDADRQIPVVSDWYKHDMDSKTGSFRSGDGSLG